MICRPEKYFGTILYIYKFAKLNEHEYHKLLFKIITARAFEKKSDLPVPWMAFLGCIPSE